MKRISYLVVFFILSTVLPSFAIERVSGTLTFSFDLTSHGFKKEARLWVPYPYSDRYQSIENLRMSGTQSYFGIHTDKKYKRLIIFARWDKGIKDRRLTISFHIKRLERLDKTIPFKEPCWDKSQFKPYLEPSTYVVIDDKVKRLSKRIVQGRNSIREKALLIYDWVVRNMHRKPETCYCGSGDVLSLLDELKGNCVDIHSVFVALLRAAGVPAREVFGIRLARNKKIANITKSQHCWAEYFLPGYGWVVMDPADCLKKMLIEGIDLNSEKGQRYYEYFLGGVDAERVRFGTGRDIVLNPTNAKGPLNYFMYPYGEVGDVPLDFLNPKGFFYKITFVPDQINKYPGLKGK